MTLTWDAAADADSVYKVYKRDGAAFSVAAGYYYDKTTDTTYTITGLDNDTRYYFRVAAVNKEGYEGTSAAIDITPTYSGPVWWVSTTGSDNNEGSSGSPFQSIEHAIDHVTAGDTVMLKKGTYTGSSNRGIEISINDQETNFDNYKNVVITSEKGPDSTIIDANYQGNHFLLQGDNKGGLDSTFQFIGLTFTNGLSKYPGGSFVIQGDGGTSNSKPKMQPKFENCIFKNNEAKSSGNDYVSGGAFSIAAATPIFENCVFENNKAWGAGGAIDIQQMWSITDTTWIRNTVFRNNISHNEGNNKVSAVEGGAIHVSQGINLIISSSNFINNQAIRYSDDDWQGVRGGAIKIGRSWDLEKNPLIKIYNSRFSKNQSINYAATQANAGAISAGAPIWIANSVIDSNSTISANSAGGGAFEFNIEQNQTLGTCYLINNTIVHNTATSSASSNGNSQSRGGAISIYQTKGIWFNNIFWGNDSDQEPGRKAFEIQDINDISQNYNNVQYKDETEALSGFQFGDNTYSLEPGFYSATNYQLSTGSPLIGAGTSSYDGHNAPGKDILGNDRPNPSGSNPDLGAYENALAESPYPKQVQNLVVQGGSREVTLSWDANTETDIVKYLVYKSENKGFMPASSDSVDETTSTSYTVTGLDNRIEYHFTVAAVNSSGYRGTFANQVSATPRYNGPNWYVAVDGSNGNDGNADAPLSDLKTAIDSAKTGHTVILLAGSHSGPENREIMLVDGIAIRIIGDPNSNVEDVVLDAGNSGRHFNIFGDYDSTMVFKNITFRGGSGQGDGGSWLLAGSIRIEGGSYWDEQQQQQVEGYPSPKFIGCVWEDNHVGGDSDWGAGGAIAIRDASPIFVSCTFKNNSASMRGGAFYSQTINSQEASSPEFRYTIFSNNSVDSQNDPTEGGAVNLEGAGEADFIDCLFEYNVAHSGNSNASGGAVALEYWQPDFGSNVLFDRCVFVNNVAESNSSGSGAEGGALSSSTPFEMVNSVVIKNRVRGDWGVGGGIAIKINDQDGTQGHSVLINNTIVDNEVLDNNGNHAFSGGGIAAINSPSQGGLWFNNIVYGNQSGNNHSIYMDGGANIDMAYLSVDDEEGKTWFDASTMVTGTPKFKNPTSGDYRLSSTSILIDAGASNYGGENAPQVDARNYYRLGLPDIGALETGASKYLLAMADDITDDKDTTFVELTQEVKFTITTGDIDGNIITDSNEPVKWDIFPNQKYARVDTDADTSTSGGSASATVTVTSEEKGKGFRFRLIADVGGAFLRSEMYVIEELVTGAPPPVANLTIMPSDWTNQPNFTLNWDIPSWAAQRELIGAVVEINDGINTYNQYMGFPSGDTLTNYSFTAPEAGQYEAYLWLIDELGNEDKDSSRSVTAYFDDVAPEAFQIHSPESLEEIIYTSDKPRFYWEESGDYPSGIKEWRLFINNNVYGTYMVNDVTYDNGDVYIDAENALADGYYDWYLEAVDYAENSTMSSDTGHFGVDLSAPNINHPGPLTQVDEGTTTPTINVSFSDGASGVNFGRLHYRRSGSGSGFVTIDLLGGPVSIPGSDVKAEGFEYYIDTEDNVGNYGYWPTDKALQSVRVRSEAPITTAQRWSNGIPGGTDSTNYLFFSIPFEVSGAKSAITSLMGPPDEFKYRLYAYNNGWQEDPSSVTMGNAYFFIFDPDKYTETPNLSFDFGQGVSTATDPPYQVNVTPGQWKFFGSPYNYNVPLDNVYTEDDENIRDAGSIYTWSGSWSNAGSSLQPWKGYVFKSGGATELNIDARGSGFGKMAKAMNTDDYPMDADEWIIDMIATTGNARDKLNAVGVRHMAEDGYDRLDEFEPPAVMGDIVLRIDNRDREESPDLYAMDIRKPNEAGHYWDLQVFTPTNGGRTYLTFDGLGYIPEEYDIFLINKTTKQAKNLEWESSYRFANTGSESHLRQDLRLVVGTKQFVEDNNAGVNLYPDAFVLSQNYPNPFNPQTSIMISLEQDAQLNLIIYNLLGEEITRLAANEHRPAGYYNFIWNGTNAMGSKVSTGVYFYHAMIQDAQGKVVLNKTRKMIFLK